MAKFADDQAPLAGPEQTRDDSSGDGADVHISDGLCGPCQAVGARALEGCFEYHTQSGGGRLVCEIASWYSGFPRWTDVAAFFYQTVVYTSLQ